MKKVTDEQMADYLRIWLKKMGASWEFYSLVLAG